MNNSPRISREICRGQCMFCKQCGEVVWEYDEDRREVIAVTCVDVETCAAAQGYRSDL